MKKNEYIGIFDSGLGGLSVWREIIRLLPNESTLYLADQARVPYGSRSLNEVCEFAEQITQFLLKEGAKIIVIACNAASAAALYHLRNIFPDVPFVGMEPALKPAVNKTRAGVVGVLATQATFQGELFANLIDKYSNETQVITQACPGLVEVVESGELDTGQTETLLRKYLSPMIEARVDQVVLGCTHFAFLRPLIEKILEKDISVIDPAPAVARRVANILNENITRPGRPVKSDQDREHKVHRLFYTTANADTFSRNFERYFPALCDGPIDLRSVKLDEFSPIAHVPQRS